MLSVISVLINTLFPVELRVLATKNKINDNSEGLHLPVL